MFQVGTPDSVPESMLPSIVDPRDYDRLRFMQMNGGTGNSFEETIHRVSSYLIYTMPILCQFDVAICRVSEGIVGYRFVFQSFRHVRMIF
jgi:hypothetical protein